MTTYIHPDTCTNQHHYFKVTVSGLGFDVAPMPGTRCECGKTEYVDPKKYRADYHQDVFDIVKFNFREERHGMVGVHIWKSGYQCTYLAIPTAALVSPLWESLRVRVAEIWEQNIFPNEPTCKNCGGLILINRRSYEGREFCALCGRDL